jgi:fumarate reductase flavoprotein subunit
MQQADVTIIGGGIAGLMAANRLAQLGITSVVLEQGTDEHYPCNTRYTGGTFHLCLRNIMLEEQTLSDEIVGITGGFVERKLADMLSAEGRRAVRWLQTEGIRFMKASGADVHNWVLAPPSRNRPGLDWQGRAGDVLLKRLEAQLASRGGSIVRGTRATALAFDDGRCSGVVATQNGIATRYTGKAVIIADGGFQGDAALVKEYVCAHPERMTQRGAGTGRGDGLKMAKAAGAKLIGMDRFFGHVMSRDSMTNDQLWPYPYGDAIATAAIVIGPDARRIADEGRGGVCLANHIAKLDDPFSAHIVFDHAIWEGPGRRGFIPANPCLPEVGGTLIRADSLEALAQAIKVSSDALAATVRAYNDAIANKKFDAVVPARTPTRFTPMPIKAAPYYAIPVCPGITNTMGGIAINEHAQALREDESTIAGLYVAGCAAGGLTGGPEIGYVGGLAIAAATALRAAEHIAAR